jgi:hypothetical protein
VSISIRSTIVEDRHVPNFTRPPSLERLAQFFGVPIRIFFPQAQQKSRANALLSATANLDDDDLEEVNAVCPVLTVSAWFTPPVI